jgi:hypothetical protein
MNSRRRISALQRFDGKPIAIRVAMEPVLMAVLGTPETLTHLLGNLPKLA